MKKRNKLLITASVIIMLLTLGLSANAALVGDVTGDGDGITALDARMILRASVGLETLSEEALLLADTNLDGNITALDARTVLRMSVDLEETVHFYKKEVLTSPDCANAGTGRATCTECEDVYEYDIPALGHDFSEPEILTQVTCEEDGLEKYTCQREGCGHTEERVVAKGHTPNIPEATCTEDQFCTRGEHIMTEKLGHTTDWGVCSRCKVYITDRYAFEAETIKNSYLAAKAEFDKAYEINSYNSMIDGISWKVLPNTKAAKKNYTAAKAAYEAAYAACGDIPEFADIKVKLKKNIENLDGVLAQVEKIIATPFFDNRNFEELVWPLECLNDFNSDSIRSTNKALSKLIKW